MGSQLIFNRNISYLKETQPEFAESVSTAIPDDVEILISRTGDPTARVNGTLLHSMFDPYKEARRFVDGNPVSPGSIVLLYGFGLGYHALEIARRIGHSGKLIIVELNSAILRTALDVADFEELFSVTNCELIFPRHADDIKRDLEKLQDVCDNGGCTVLVHQPSFKCISPEYKQAGMMFETTLIQNRTAGLFRKHYVSNFEKNIDTVLSYPGISDVKDFFTGCPAILIGAGPSLDDSIPLLRKYSERAILMAVDSAFPILMRRGVRPDFVVSVDPQPVTLKHFEGCERAGVPLIVTPVSCSQVLEIYKGPFLIFMQKNHSFTSVMEPYLGSKGFSYAGGSVSCIAFDILSQWGCSPVIFVGMDYAYPSGKAYSSLSFESLQLFAQTNRFFTAESAHRRRIDTDKPVYVQSYSDKPVRSSVTLCEYRKNIENLVAMNRPNMTTYNISNCGAFIKNVRFLPAQEIDAILNLPVGKSFCVSASTVDASLKRALIGLCG
ncbi:MAG: DUF115 domain-containing protein [Candidatus Auribacterota bacterium]|jgi:hypothetical protein|nr:DUF115 domain-containing protein [Candidatus Auribacterota bacterium]